MRTFFIAVLALFSQLALAVNTTDSPVRTVIIIGVDGLSPRGVDEGLTPNMNRLIAQGFQTGREERFCRSVSR